MADMTVDQLPERANGMHSLFKAVIALKGFFGLIEFVGGVALLTMHHSNIMDWANWFIQGELIKDPHDVFALSVMHWAESFTNDAQMFAALYLLAHGVVKIILVASLLLEKKWAFPLALVLFSLLVLFSVHRLALHWSWFLFAFVIFDFFAIWLIAKEWRTTAKVSLRL